jgi:hypothetical protein
VNRVHNKHPLPRTPTKVVGHNKRMVIEKYMPMEIMQNEEP